MNVLRGLVLRGLKLNTEENFNSIPGLSLWLDARERANIINGEVATWGDKSTLGNNLIKANGGPVREKGIWMMSTDNHYMRAQNPLDFRFLHNGSRFAIFCINKNDWEIANTGSGFGPMWTSSASGTGMQIAFSTAGNGQINMNLRNGGAGNSRSLSNLLNPAHANYSPSGNIYIQSMANFGQNLGTRITYGNAVANLAPFYGSLASYPQGSHQTFGVNQATTLATKYRGGLLLVYNWGFEYSDVQVQSFYDRVMSLLAKEKIKFLQADI